MKQILLITMLAIALYLWLGGTMTTTPRSTRTRKLKKAQFILLQVELPPSAQFHNRAWVYRAMRNMGYKWNTESQRWVKEVSA